MRDEERFAALAERSPLGKGETLTLRAGQQQPVSFRVESLLGAGGTSLVYQATRISETEGEVRGSLKEFYPALMGSSYDMEQLICSMSVKRDPDGSLQMSEQLCRDQVGRLEAVMGLLHDLKKHGDLNYFIPYMQIYQGRYGVPYVFTPENVNGITLKEYLETAHADPTPARLSQILNTMYALASADHLLCSRGALLLDIKPENVLIIRRSGAHDREDAYLADAVSLFDLESILLQSELAARPRLPVSPGFTAPELGGGVMRPRYYKIGPAADVYALTATLLYALTGQVQAEVEEYGEALMHGPFAEEMQDANVRSMLERLLDEGLRYDAAQRLATPQEFAARVMEVAERVETIRAVSAAKDQQEQAEKLPDMLTHLLFRWPLHEYAADRDMRVLIAGDSDDAIQKTLDAVFSSCHVLGYQLHIAVASPRAEAILQQWAGKIDRAADWLEIRGAAPFARYDWETSMAQICCENIEPDSGNIARLVDRWDANAVLLMTDNLPQGRALAQAIPGPAQGRRLIAYRGRLGKTLHPESQQENRVVICMTPAACEDGFWNAANRIGFNSHLLYMREQDARNTLRHIRREYRDDAYNYTSSQSTALAVKCKLWSAGVPWTDDLEQDAAAFAQKLQQDPTLVGRISWLEHRRWVASKLVKGTRTMPEQDFDLLLAANNNGSGTSIWQEDASGRRHLYHAYLVPGRLEDSRPEGWQTPRQWADQPLDTPIPEELDPLDHACVALTRMYIRNAQSTDLNLSGRMLFASLERIEQWMRGRNPAAAAAFALLVENMRRAVKNLEHLNAAQLDCVAPYEICRMQLQDALEKQTSPWQPAALSALEGLNRDATVRIQAVRGIDSKRYDITLVENMHFVLCGGGLVMGKLLSDSCLLDNVLPAEQFLTERVVYIAYADSSRTAEKYAGIYGNICRYFTMRGMDSPVELRLFAAPGAEMPPCDKKLQWIPVEGDLADCFTAHLSDCTALDITGGQSVLAAVSTALFGGSPAMSLFQRGEDGYRCLRGSLPPRIPVCQPMDIDADFALSGATVNSAEILRSGSLYREIYDEIRHIRQEMGARAWDDACGEFCAGMKESRTPGHSEPQTSRSDDESPCIRLPQVSASSAKIYSRFARRGWLEWNEPEQRLSNIRPELARLLQKFGSTPETDVYMQLVQSGLFDACKVHFEYQWEGENGPVNELDVTAICGDRLVLVSCKAGRELTADMAYEICTEAENLRVNALPVIVAAELQPEMAQPFRHRCGSLHILLIDASGQQDCARLIAAAAAE